MELAHTSVRDRTYSLRFNRPCPICGGGQDGHNRHGTQCTMGLESEDGRYAHCGAIPSGHPDKNGQTWAHPLDGPCDCGESHGATPRLAIVRTPAKPLREIHGRQYLPATVTEGFATYTFAEDNDFTAEDGTLRYVERRYERPSAEGGKPDKTIRQYTHRGGDVWVAALECEPLLFNLPAIMSASVWTPIYVFEGPRKARIAQEALHAAGEIGVCTSASGSKGGASKVDMSPLRNRRLIVACDNDTAGDEYAQIFARRALDAGAASVHSLHLPDLPPKGDVVEYLAAGHDGADLARLAADAPIIAARMVESRNISGALKLEQRECKQCASLREQLTVAETTVRNLRERMAAHDAILSLPKEQLAPSLKPAAIATYDLLKSPKMRDEDGREQVYLAAIAKHTGAAKKTTGTQLRALHKIGFVDRKPVPVEVVTDDGRTEIRTEIRIKEGPLFATPEKIEERELTKRWGGSRPRCKSCGSHNIQATAYVCRDCGDRMTRAEALAPDAPEPPDDTPPTQMTSGALKLEQREEWPESDDVGDALPEVEPEDRSSSQEDLNRRSTSGNGAQEDADERHELLNLAERLGWPRIPLDLQHIIGHYAGDAQAWRDFADTASPEDLDTIRYRLMAKQAALSGGD